MMFILNFFYIMTEYTIKTKHNHFLIRYIKESEKVCDLILILVVVHHAIYTGTLKSSIYVSHHLNERDLNHIFYCMIDAWEVGHFHQLNYIRVKCETKMAINCNIMAHLFHILSYYGT